MSVSSDLQLDLTENKKAYIAQLESQMSERDRANTGCGRLSPECTKPPGDEVRAFTPSQSVIDYAAGVDKRLRATSAGANIPYGLFELRANDPEKEPATATKAKYL